MADITALRENKISAVRLSGIRLFSPEKTFDCGQSFRFERVLNSRHEQEFGGVAHGKYISFAIDGDDLYVYNASPEEFDGVWRSYLGLDRDYNAINQSILSLSDNPALSAALIKSEGIRILRQDPWETLCSFIISQNNNIPRIKSLIAALCRSCGEECDVQGMEGHIADAHLVSDGALFSFPSADAVAALGVDGLRELKMGFRARYIMDAASRVISGETQFDSISSMSTAEASAELCKICGVGPKVASCALLFGHSKLDAFPIDVWIKKVICKYFDNSLSPESLGEYAGVAQQYLFYYERFLNN